MTKSASKTPAAFRAFLFISILPTLPFAQSLSELSSLRSHSGHAASMPISPTLFPGGLPSSLGENMSLDLLEQDGFFEPVSESLYVVGPGDAFIVGFGSKSALLPVNPEGSVVIENVGPVAVSGKPLHQAKKDILLRAAKVYRGDRLYAALAKAKRIQVSIAGAVKNPGLHVIGATARLSDVISLAGGFAPSATRQVKVVGRLGDTARYDVDRYVHANDISQNPYLFAGDLVRAEEVDYHGDLVELRENEQISRVQLKDGHSAKDLVEAYYRSRNARPWDVMRVYRGGKLERTLSKQEAATFVLSPGDVVELSAYKPFIFVTGAVSRPSALEYNLNFSALDYISSAGILPITGAFEELEVVDSAGVTRWVDASRDKIFPGDHILVPQSKESRAREWIGLIASIASIFASITLTVVTLNQ